MNIEQIITELEPLASERTKKRYMSQGAREPLYGMSIKSLKPMAKKLMKLDNTQEIAYNLFDTGNYDLMYLAGMIVDPNLMTHQTYNQWIEKAYFYMISDYIVAVCLCESDMADVVADQWIKSGDDLPMSAGYSTYCWRLGNQADDKFSREKLFQMLNEVGKTIHQAPNRTRYAMQYFIYTLGVSYIPLHREALAIATEIGDVVITEGDGEEKIYTPSSAIQKQLDQGRLGFKRRYVRC